jgi:hypothetical protein
MPNFFRQDSPRWNRSVRAVKSVIGDGYETA